MKTLFYFFAVLLVLQSCTSSEIGNSKDVNPETIYRSYTISYTEGDLTARCFCQFRFAGENGTTLVLSNPSNITLDGDTLHLDSGRVSGAYYYADRPFEGFAGKHNLVYTDVNGKNYPQTIDFKVVTLSTTIPGETNAADMPLSFTGVKDGDVIHVQVADTASSTEDVDVADTIRNGQILLNARALATQKNGPLEIKFYVDAYTPLDNPTNEGGRVNFYYKLKPRKTILKN